MGVAEVQQKLLELVSSETVLIGHSLESDLRALKVGQPDRPPLLWMSMGDEPRPLLR